MKRLMRRAASCLAAAALAAGMVPIAAIAAPAPSVGEAKVVQIEDGGTAPGAETGVFIDVLDDFRLIEMTPSFIVEGAQAALDYAQGRLFATLDGGSGVASAIWKVADAEGDIVGEFEAKAEPGGKWVLPLSAGPAEGALDVSAPCEYTCTFQAVDRSASKVSGTMTFQVLAPGEVSDYAAKTVYKDHEQTFDGVEAFAEPSATGLIHGYVQHLSAVAAAPGSEVWEELSRIAAGHAASQGGDGAYAFCTAWSLAALFTHEVAGEPAPYKGSLSVVLPLPDTGPSAGEQVVVFGYGAEGAIDPIECTVEQTAQGERYVRFTTESLGAFAVGSYEDALDAFVRVVAASTGSGSINYEGAYSWPRTDTKRYLFTPEDGSRIARIAASAGGGTLDVPASALMLGYWDLDLSALDPGIDEVVIEAVFEPAQIDPDEDEFAFTVEVVEGTGDVSVNGRDAEDGPFRFGGSDDIELLFAPTSPSLSVKSAILHMDGLSAPLPLAISSGRAHIYGITGDARVEVAFSSDAPAPGPSHTVSLIVFGGASGHGSVDAPYAQGPVIEASRTVEAGGTATFSLHPEAGYAIYTVMEGTRELGDMLASSASGLTLTLPNIQRDRSIVATFSKAEDMPPIIPADEYATIEVESVVAAGSATAAPAIVTPPSAIVPKGSGYSFSIIPGNDASTLASVHVKAEGELAWRDITAQVWDAWVEWPDRPEGTLSTGYYDLSLTGIAADTFVRVVFRDAAPDDPPRPPTPTRELRINVTGEGGTVSPNTVGKPALLVPVGKAVQVIVIRADGAYVSSVVSSGKGMKAPAGSTVDVTGKAKDTTGTAGLAADKDVLDGEGTFEIPDSAEDEEWTFDFSFGGPDGPGPDEPGTDGPGTDEPGIPSATFTVSPVAVPGADGKVHGSISPASPVSVPAGDAAAFSFACEAGYKVSAVTANGRVIAKEGAKGCTLQDIREDIELRVAFAPLTEEDAITPAKRPIHRLQALAQTGDHLPVLVFALTGLGCAALGVLFLVSRRPKCRDEEDE